MSDPADSGTERLKSNIDLVERRRARVANEATLPTRLAHSIGAFAGSMTFVGLHALLFGAWAAINFGWIKAIAPFDPSFVGLGTTASVEAIFLSTFVLISQNRLAEADERHADLDLQINLLAEHELTRLAALTERIAAKMDIDVDDPAFAEVKRDIAPEEVLDTLDEARRSGG